MKNKITLILIIIILLLCSCQRSEVYKTDNFFAMDTFISTKCDTTSKNISIIQETIFDIENKFSKTLPDSEISKINSSFTAQISDECADILSRLSQISSETEGAFNPCMEPIISLWDITGKKHIPDDEEIQNALNFCDANSYTVSANTLTKKHQQSKLDLGAAIKGYAAQKAIENIINAGVVNAMVNIGGNIAVCGHSETLSNSWRVGITNPFAPETIAGYIDCTDTIISVSGDYERYFEKDGIIYHHIFDPKTGKPADNDIKCVAVISADGLVSDALSTALFVMGKDKALEFYKSSSLDFEAIIFTKDKNVFLTDGISSSFVLYEESELNLVQKSE